MGKSSSPRSEEEATGHRSVEGHLRGVDVRRRGTGERTLLPPPQVSTMREKETPPAGLGALMNRSQRMAALGLTQLSGVSISWLQQPRG